RRSLRDMRADNAGGMVASQLTMWFIIVLTGTVLHGAGVTSINTAADAARALEPLVKTFPHSGEIAQGLFALGIVSLGMLAIPVMAGSTSYAFSEARGKKEGLDLKPRQGRYFYGVIAAAMVIGLCLNFIGVNPSRISRRGRRRSGETATSSVMPCPEPAPPAGPERGLGSEYGGQPVLHAGH